MSFLAWKALIPETAKLSSVLCKLFSASLTKRSNFISYFNLCFLFPHFLKRYGPITALASSNYGGSLNHIQAGGTTPYMGISPS